MMPMTPDAPSNSSTAGPSGVPISSPNPQFDALLRNAGIAPLDQTGWIRITGSDRERWLNGMATNSVQHLAPGTGAYNFFLNAQGRIQADGNIFAFPEELWIETGRSQIATLIPYLDHYIIMDDVELADVTSTRHGFTLIGPRAGSLLATLGLSPEGLSPLGVRSLSWNSSSIILIHAHSPLVSRYELWADSPEMAQTLRQALQSAGAIACDPTSLEWLRLLEGTPLYSVDIRDRDLPQETNQTRALHFNKGCYLGQEIVERIRSRGNVHRTLSLFRLEGALPSPGTAIEAAGKQVGELTSAIAIPVSSGTLQLALGYIRREALDRREPLQYNSGTAFPAPAPFSTVETEIPAQASDS
jgi:folate-binding protein YgfZ